MLFLPGMHARNVSPLLLPYTIFTLLISISAILSPDQFTGGTGFLSPAVVLSVCVAVYIGSLALFLSGRNVLPHPWAPQAGMALGSAALMIVCSGKPDGPAFLGAAAFTTSAALAGLMKKPQRSLDIFGAAFPLLWLTQAITGFSTTGLRVPNFGIILSPIGLLFALSFVLNLLTSVLPHRDGPIWKAGWYGISLGLVINSLSLSSQIEAFPSMGILTFFAVLFFLNERSANISPDLYDFNSDERRLTWLMACTLLLVTFGLRIFNLRFLVELPGLPAAVETSTIPAMAWVGICGISLSVTITLLMHQQSKLQGIVRELQTGHSGTTQQTDLPLGERLEATIALANGALRRASSQNQTLTAQLSEIAASEKQLRQKFLSLITLTQQLNAQLDPPVTAQMTANLLQRAIGCELAAILLYSPEDNRFFPIATAGTSSGSLSVGFRIKSREGLIERALKTQRATLLNERTASQEALRIGDTFYKSILTAPMITNGYHEGVIILADQRAGFFSADDITLTEAVTDRLVFAWQQTRGNQALEALIKEGITLTHVNDAGTILRLVAEISRKSIKAQLALVVLQYQGRILSAKSGQAAKWTEKLIQENNPYLDEFRQFQQPLRVRDSAKDSRFQRLIPSAERPRSLMIVPLTSKGEGTGFLLLAGKKNGLIFEERDAFLGSILANQASAALENCLLNEDILENLRSTQLLNILSNRIEASTNLQDAAQAITQTALQLTQGSTCGLILFSQNEEVEASLISGNGSHKRRHPQAVIRQVLQTRQIVYLDKGDRSSLACFPLLTARRVFGALWIELLENEDTHRNSRTTENLRMLINQATMALERSLLLNETRKQADALSSAYADLEQIYDQTLGTLMSALDARDHETEGHCNRVTELAISLGRQLGLRDEELKALERGALLHDIGKIGISDTILHKPGPLTEEEWEEMRQHPIIGAKILEGIPFLRDAMPVVAGHQERYDGSGYPLGLKGEQIPVLARIFAVADVFDALLSERPYHEKKTILEARDYMRKNAGSEFDPRVVDILLELTGDPNFLKSLGYENAS